MTLALTTAMLDRLWPHAPHSLVDGMAATSEKVFAKYGLTTAAEVADFMAQITEETGGGYEIEEDLN
jgi:predicted chitinase